MAIGFMRETWPSPAVEAMFTGIEDSCVCGLQWLMLLSGTIGANVVSLIEALIFSYLTSLPVVKAGPQCIHLSRFSGIVASIL